MKRTIINQQSERGAISLILAATVLSVSLVVLYQVSFSNSALNQMHSRSKGNYVISQARLSLAQVLRNAYNLGQLNPTCSESIERENFMMMRYAGATLCIPRKGLCARIKLGEEASAEYCASTNQELMDWETNSGSTRPRLFRRNAFHVQAGEEVNRITVPKISNANYWRSCDAPATCVRLVVCPEGRSNCSLNQAVSIQVVRLGSL